MKDSIVNENTIVEENSLIIEDIEVLNQNNLK